MVICDDCGCEIQKPNQRSINTPRGGYAHSEWRDCVAGAVVRAEAAEAERDALRAQLARDNEAAIAVSRTLQAQIVDLQAQIVLLQWQLEAVKED